MSFLGFLGDSIDNVGTFFNLPEWGISEGQAGGKTVNTGRVKPSGTASNSPLLNGAHQTQQVLNNMNFGGGQQTKRNDGVVTDGGGGTVYNGGTNYAAQNAAAISQLGQSESVINNALARLAPQLDIAFGNIDRNYSTRQNELNTTRDSSEKQYKTQTTQNQQSFRGNKNVINDQASSGLRGLQRLLGSYGAVGSDMGLAGRAVSDVASQQNSGAGQAFSQNQQSLDTNWGNFQNQFENEKRKVDDWRNQERQKVEQQSLTTRQDLLSKLADIRGQMAAARGGSYASSAQPFLDQANSFSSRIDQLGAINPTYTGVTPQYQEATLDSYDTGNGASIGVRNPLMGGLNTPFLNSLLGGRDKERKQLV